MASDKQIIATLYKVRRTVLLDAAFLQEQIMFPVTMFYIMLAVCAVGSVERYHFVDAALVDRSNEGTPHAYQVNS